MVLFGKSASFHGKIAGLPFFFFKKKLKKGGGGEGKGREGKHCQQLGEKH